MCFILSRATFLFIELNAFEASTNRTPSVSGCSNLSLTACTAASPPLGIPEHVCRGPAAAMTSFFTTHKMTLPITLRKTSPTPIGRTPGFLLRGTNLQDRKASRAIGDTQLVLSLLVILAIDSHRLLDASLKDEHIFRQARESTPDGPAEPLQCRTISLIKSPLMELNMTGSTGRALSKVLSSRASGSTALASGWSDKSASRTDFDWPSLQFRSHCLF